MRLLVRDVGVGSSDRGVRRLGKLAQRLGDVGPRPGREHRTQLYSEPEPLAAGGLVEEEREQTGRRRRTYSVTAAGRAALADWLAAPAALSGELRDPGLLQLFFGADQRALAGPQRDLHAAKLDEYEALHARVGADLPSGERLALEAGIAHEHEWVRFWSELGDRR